MKNTKKAVALALALTVGSQAGMSFAEEIKEPTDVVAPSSRSDLEVKVDGDEITINQKGIYDLESGIDADSVKAYVHEEGDYSKGEEIEMKGNDFSDFTATVENPSNGEDLVVDVYASDIAGNESKVGSTVVNLVEEEEPAKCGNVDDVKKKVVKDFAQGEFGGFYCDPSNSLTVDSGIVVNPNKPVIGTFAFRDNDGSFSEMSFTVTSKPDSHTSGLLMRGVVNKDGNMSTTSLSSCVEVTDFDFYYNGYGVTTVDLTFDFSGSPEGSDYYLWVKNPNGSYVKVDASLIADTKAPVAKKDLALNVTDDGTLMISQDEVIDEGSAIYEVYANVRARVGDLNETIYLDGYQPDPNVWNPPTKFDGTLNLKEHGYDRGVFFVDVYAVDSVGNEGLVSSGTVEYNMTIDSKETVSVSGYGAQENGNTWYKFEDTLRIEAVSESKGEVYPDVQLVINEDPSNYKNKVLTSIELGHGTTNNTNLNHKYFGLVSEKYTSTASSDSNYDYTNRAVLELKMDRGLYNKDLYVWAIFKGNNAIYAEPVKFEGNIKTDYSVPTATITKESNNYVIKAKDDESGLKSMVAYDSNGLVVSDSHTDGVMTISEDLNPSTVTITDVAGNVRVFNVKTGEGIDGIGSEVMVPPVQGDDYINLGGDDEEEEVPPAFPPTGGDNMDGFPPIVPDDKPSTPPTGDNNGGNDNNGGTENKPSTPEDKPTVPPAEDGGNDNATTPDKPSTPDNGDNDNVTTPDKPTTPGDNNDGAGTDIPDNSENNGSNNDGNNGSVEVKPEGGNDSTNNGSTNNDENSESPKLPQTGEPISMLAGALGVITSGLGFVLTRKKK